MKMHFFLPLASVGALVLACGGNISLGNTGSNLGSDAGSPDCTAKDACGPALGAPAITCPDGSIGGNTGKCLAVDGKCGWEVRECPSTTPACFDSAGAIQPQYRKCATVSDCVVVEFQQDCCGTPHLAGVATTSEADVEQCAKDRAAAFPACGCATQGSLADDGSRSTDPGSAASPALSCNAGLCETSFKTTACGTNTCTASQTCCSGVPFATPTCVDGTMCPISQRKAKKDITYVSESEKERLTQELLGFRLATYRYKTEHASDREHLGFIIDDVAPSPAVVASGERVDMYGYATMSVAALQTQARELAELREQVRALKGEIEHMRGKTTPR